MRATAYFCCSPGLSIFAKKRGVSWRQTNAINPVSSKRFPCAFACFSSAASNKFSQASTASSGTFGGLRAFLPDLRAISILKPTASTTSLGTKKAGWKKEGQSPEYLWWRWWKFPSMATWTSAVLHLILIHHMHSYIKYSIAHSLRPKKFSAKHAGHLWYSSGEQRPELSPLVDSLDWSINIINIQTYLYYKWTHIYRCH